eukprot:scaffold28993_cov34-Phaeocystis_antarctica.AAC.3
MAGLDTADEGMQGVPQWVYAEGPPCKPDAAGGLLASRPVHPEPCPSTVQTRTGFARERGTAALPSREEPHPARRASPDDSDMESVPSLEEETETSEPESGSSDDESHDVNHADNRLASAQRELFGGWGQACLTPTIKGGSQKPRSWLRYPAEACTTCSLNPTPSSGYRSL